MNLKKNKEYMKKHYTIVVKGRVQGVYYRASAHEKAVELGLNGFVSNLQDGNVYIEAEGEPEILEKFVEWCKIGPARAKVESVEVKEETVEGFRKFEIRK
jgi:acylphosphatase